MSVILDVAIGVALIYLLFSMLVSAVAEILASLLNWRGRMLENAVVQLLDGPLPGAPPPVSAGTGADAWDALLGWCREFFRTGRRTDLAPSSLADAVLGHGLLSALFHGDRLPSYLPPERFADALIDVLRRRAGEGQPTFAGLQGAIGSLPAGETAQALGTLLTASGGDITSLRSQITTWYGDVMDRVSGWYARRTRYVLLALGLATAIGFNVDSFHLVRAIAHDAPLRESLVRAAANTPAPAPTEEGVKAAEEQLSATLTRIRELQLPIGWPDACNLKRATSKDRVCDRSADANLWLLLPAIVGWIITALALSQGAPFWFDLMQKFLSIRGTGGKPEETRLAAPETSTPASTTAAALPWSATNAAGNAGQPPAEGLATPFEAASLSLDDIRMLQRKLGAPETGVIDVTTRALVRRAQRAVGQTADGLLTFDLVRMILADR